MNKENEMQCQKTTTMTKNMCAEKINVPLKSYNTSIKHIIQVVT